jgi:hypothetical protein
MSARHRADPQYDPRLAPGVNNRAPELLLAGITGGMDGAPAIDGFECPHCGVYDPQVREVLVALIVRKADPNDGGYLFRELSYAQGSATHRHLRYECDHCDREVRIVTGHAVSLPII